MLSDLDDHLRVIVADVSEPPKELKHLCMALSNSRLAAVGSPIGLLDGFIGYRFEAELSIFVGFNFYCVMGTFFISAPIHRLSAAMSGLSRWSSAVISMSSSICASSTTAKQTVAARGIRVSVAILVAKRLVEFRIFISKQFFVVDVEDVFKRTGKRQAAGILAAFVGGHAQLRGQPVLVVYQVAAAHVGLGHHFHAFAAGGDEHQQDAQAQAEVSAQLVALFDGVFLARLQKEAGKLLAGIVDVVEVAHVESVQHGGTLLAPAALAPLCRGGFGKGGLE